MSKSRLYNQAHKFIIEKAKYIADMKVRDRGVLKKKLTQVLIDYTCERYLLDALEKAQLTRTVQSIQQARIGSKAINLVEEPVKEPKFNVQLPKGWEEIIKDHGKLKGLKYLTKPEKTLHSNYCSKEGCAFGLNDSCPVYLGWMEPKSGSVANEK